jgi:iron-sulfur cluster repair protein YtfE (RIC family)
MSDTVSGYLSADHRRLDAIVLEAEGRARSGALADAAAVFARFAQGLDRHIRAEEEILFPAFEQVTGMLAGPTTVMRAEHAEMRKLLSDVSSALGGSDASAALGALQALTGLLSDHNMKEESILYPMMDRSARNLAELVEQVRSVVQAA